MTLPLFASLTLGALVGNPFLAKCVRSNLSKSFLKQKPDDPNDEHGHGSAVASLAAYHSLNLGCGRDQPATGLDCSAERY